MHVQSFPHYYFVVLYVNILLELQGIVLNIFYLIIMPDASTKPYNFIARSRVGASMNQILTISKKKWVMSRVANVEE
jgi:hypothetical protein